MAIAVIILGMIAGARPADASGRFTGSDPAHPHTGVALALPQIDEQRLSDDPLVCLALTLYWESRGESDLAQKAVGHVVMNRVNAAGYPSDVCSVVTQHGPEPPCQFSWWCDGRSDTPQDHTEWWRAFRNALEVYANPDADPTAGALYFHRKDLRPAWARAKVGRARVFGGHVFFRLARG